MEGTLCPEGRAEPDPQPRGGVQWGVSEIRGHEAEYPTAAPPPPLSRCPREPKSTFRLWLKESRLVAGGAALPSAGALLTSLHEAFPNTGHTSTWALGQLGTRS